MTTRNRTSRFESLRSEYKRHRLASATSHDQLVLAVGLQRSLAPEWVDVVDEIQASLRSAKQQMGALQRLHQAQLKVSFNEDHNNVEVDIQRLTGSITSEFHKAESNLKRIATVGVRPLSSSSASSSSGGARKPRAPSPLPAKERLIRLNVMRSLATEVQQQSQKFRRVQKQFVQRLRGQAGIRDNFFHDEKAIQDGGDDDEQSVAQLQLKKALSAREEEILQITQSVHEIAALFRELSVLVIEQGSVVDRIDYNVEQVLTQVQESNKELRKADEYSKQAKSVLCIIIEVVLFFALLAALIYKHSAS